VGFSWLATVPDTADPEGEGLSRAWSAIMEPHPGHILEPLVLLPMIAHATRTLRLGFNALVTPVIHPFHIARYLATLDIASNGRVTTTFAFGIPETDGTSRTLDWLGNPIPSNRRGDASVEALEIITRLWSEHLPFDFEGEFFHGKQMLVAPKPVQNPYPEIWIGGTGPRANMLAGRYGACLEVYGEALALLGSPLELIRERFVPDLERANEKWGGCANLGVVLCAQVTDKPLTSAQRAALYMYEDRPDSGYAEISAFGSPEQCAQVIIALRDAGVDRFTLDLYRHGYDSLSFAAEQADAWATEVVPLLRS
jgi:alkanesulfonate monooxygenase SsuD/methylene tetrahydromethanopterin reductase-like flavin-dependent oxidoreductase (luciferase family)